MILESALLTEVLLPFLLVFVLIFAILQKTELLGKGKAQIDALIALSIALMLIVFPKPRDIIVYMMPWVAVAAAVILVFFILYGFVAGPNPTSGKWQKIVFGVLAGIFVLVLLIFITGFWDILFDLLEGGYGDIWSNIILIIVIVGAVAVAVASGKKGGSSGSSSGKSE